MFENRQKALTIKILVGQDPGDKAQEDLKAEDSAPALLEVDKPDAKPGMPDQIMPPQEEHATDPAMSDELMGGAEQETSNKLALGQKPRGLNDAVRMSIMKKKLITK